MKTLKFFSKTDLFKYLSKEIKNKTLLIAGGRVLKKFIKYILDHSIKISNKIILSDERIVNLKSNFRNDKTIKKLLIKNDLLNKKNFINYKLPHYKKSYIIKINNILKKTTPDVAVLSIGSKGHIAGIFDLSSRSLVNMNNFNYYLSKYKKPKNRVSCTCKYINKSKKIILLVKKKNLNDLKNFKKKFSKKISLKKVTLIEV